MFETRFALLSIEQKYIVPIRFANGGEQLVVKKQFSNTRLSGACCMI